MSMFFAYLRLVNGNGLAAIGAKIRNSLTAVEAWRPRTVKVR